MLIWLKKWFHRDPKPQQKRPGQVVTAQDRLIPLVDFSRSRRTRQALLQLENLDHQTRSMLYAMQFMTSEEIHGQHHRLSRTVNWSRQWF